MFLVKITFFILYLHAFGPFSYVRVGAWVGITFTTAFYVTITAYQLVVGIPKPDETLFEHQSMDMAQNKETIILMWVQSIGGLIIDLWILIMPLFEVAKLQMPKRRKFGVVSIFFTGSLSVRFII